MNVIQTLRTAGYDFIDSPLRSHQPLQLWLKKNDSIVEFYSNDFRNQLISSKPLTKVELPMLTIDFASSIDFKFNLGLSFLAKLLDKLGLENLGIDFVIEGGREIKISYKDPVCYGYELDELQEYLSNSDVKPNSNKLFIDNLNNNDILIIGAVLFAKNIKIEITTSTNFSLETKAKLSDKLDSSFVVEYKNEQKLTLSSKNDLLLPIAVKAYRLDFDHSVFSNMRLITDHRRFF